MNSATAHVKKKKNLSSADINKAIFISIIKKVKTDLVKLTFIKPSWAGKLGDEDTKRCHEMMQILCVLLTHQIMHCKYIS